MKDHIPETNNMETYKWVVLGVEKNMFHPSNVQSKGSLFFFVWLVAMYRFKNGFKKIGVWFNMIGLLWGPCKWPYKWVTGVVTREVEL